ncbi:hypothetical protein GGH91_000224 [Coemansia sp. RSA 2671]|uniref:Uncharacterized protein n=2 Tax=Coemansia TaxID=4863 RepID=A0A9W8L5J9_9FUNG|nr:hypothetical protein LPJ60_001364 [Coemansia sp. RSA 2675]KAJ2350279.1 hypothetical protein GGH91_000224 [Coemansia sp. RSA 2671]KAJ2688630.1 hypothetical protein IWW39_002102 [Coemansia spiralis]KAJ2788920.1 hypothetical protein GGI18_002692 [Coemansia linderi]
MGLIKKIKNSYVFTQLEVGKYTKRRNGSNTARDQNTETHGTIRPGGSEFISAFDQAAEEVRREQLSASAETIRSVPSIPRFKSTVDLSATQRAHQSGPLAYAESRGTTAVSTPQTSPFSDTADSFDGQPLPRARPKGARAARSTMDMQSVYFAPGRNVSMTNQQKQRLSVYTTDVPRFDKNSASSMDYYVFTPTRREVAQMPLDAKRRTRGHVAPDELPSPSLHQEPEGLPTNPFVERRKKAQLMAKSPVSERWEDHGPSSPFADQGGGGSSADEPRRYLNTPVYASQSGRSPNGLDLLA